MRKIYNQLFAASGWWSPLAKPAGWFAEDLTASRVNAAVAVTEGADTVAMTAKRAVRSVMLASEGADSLSAEATIVFNGEPTTVLADLNVTEGADGLTASATILRRDLPPALGLAGTGSLRRIEPRKTVLARLVVREGRDGVALVASVERSSPPPAPAPALVPLDASPYPVPEPWVAPPLFRLPDSPETGKPPPPAPLPRPLPVTGSMRATEVGDSLSANATRTDWVAYDNAALMALLAEAEV